MDLFALINALLALDTVPRIIVSVVPMILAITVHETAHGYVARYFGDMTAHLAGRISLNPIRHIDPVGTILVPSITLLVGGIFFGWAKPVPVDFSKLNHPKKDMLWVALAGPASNLMMAFIWAIVIKFAPMLPSSMVVPITFMGTAGIISNTVLMILNLLPLPPLDGGRIMVSLLPTPYAIQFAKIERFGFIILIVLLVTHILDKIMGPLITGALSMIASLFL